MRVFVGILGGLFLLVGVGLGGLAVAALAGTDGGSTLRCTTYPGETSSNTTCSSSGSSSRDQATTMGFTVVGSALFIGGCALLGGAVAGGRRPAVSAPSGGYGSPAAPPYGSRPGAP